MRKRAEHGQRGNSNRSAISFRVNGLQLGFEEHDYAFRVLRRSGRCFPGPRPVAEREGAAHRHVIDCAEHLAKVARSSGREPHRQTTTRSRGEGRSSAFGRHSRAQREKIRAGAAGERDFAQFRCGEDALRVVQLISSRSPSPLAYRKRYRLARATTDRLLRPIRPCRGGTVAARRGRERDRRCSLEMRLRTWVMALTPNTVIVTSEHDARAFERERALHFAFVVCLDYAVDATWAELAAVAAEP